MVENGEMLPTVETGETLAPKRIKANNLLWFVGGRTYVPLPDVRRRFGLPETEGVLLRDTDGSFHIGLPLQAAEVLMDLRQKGKIDFVYDLEHAFRIVVGVFPSRLRLRPSTDGAASNGVVGAREGSDEKSGENLDVKQSERNDDSIELGRGEGIASRQRVREHRRGRGRRRR